MDVYDRARLRSALLLGGIGSAVDAADKDADARRDAQRPDGYAYDPAHSNAHAYGPHVPTPSRPRLSLCDSVAHAYADGVPERGMDSVKGRYGLEGGRDGDAGLRRGTVERPAGHNGHRGRNNDPPVQVDRKEVKP